MQMNDLTPEDQVKLDAIRKKAKITTDNNTKGFVNECPKCMRHGEKEFDTCPTCGLIIKKYFASSSLPSVLSGKRKNRRREYFVVDEKKPMIALKVLLILSFIPSLLLTIFAKVSRNPPISDIFSILSLSFLIFFLVFFLIYILYKIISGEGIVSDSAQNVINSRGANLLGVLFVIIIGGYFVGRDKSPDFEMTANQLYYDFDKNELAATSKYKDKT